MTDPTKRVGATSAVMRPSASKAGARRDLESDAQDLYEGSMFDLLLQEHRSSQTRLLAYDLIGRLISVSLIVYLGVVATFSTAQLVSGMSAITLVSVSWLSGRRRAARRTRSVEETLGRMAGGSTERAYIESRFIAESGRNIIDRMLQAEPLLWFYASLIVILVGTVINGIS